MSKRHIGPFVIESKLGVGGMGIVYLATYTKNGRKVALKVLTPALNTDKKLVDRFNREINILKKLKHPNIVKYYGGGVHGDQRYYAMELIDGGSLYDHLRKRGKLSWEHAIQVARQVCSALEHAHRHGIIHRDLKPGNLFINRKGQLKLGDFGIARDTEATALTAAGKTVGTYAYMAPEQIDGRAPISGKTDLYALGCLLFELLTGRPPFTSENPAEMLMMHIQDDPPDVAEFAVDCPIYLDQIVMRLLEKNPQDRPYDALAVHTELGEIREKIATGLSVAQQKAQGDTKATREDKTDLKKILRRKKKKKKSVPFHEQTWFLVSCLLLLVTAVTWALWPYSEDKLYELAGTAMATDDSNLHREALREYIEPYLTKYPDGKYADEFEQWADTIEMNKIERQAESRYDRELDPGDSYQSLFFKGLRFEKFRDRISAREQYQSMLNLLENEEAEEARIWVGIIRRRISEIEKDRPDAADRLELIKSELRQAEQMLQSGDRIGAEKIWRSLDSLYSGNQELSVLIGFAKARLDDQPTAVPDLSPGPGTSDRGEKS